MLEIQRYEQCHRDNWDAFVSRSKNGAFLFHRGYQDYHADRFTDHSYLFLKGGKILGLLPASVSGDELCSHGGLTFGGVITDEYMTQGLMLGIFEKLMARLRTDGIRRFVYKAPPDIYHSIPAEEDAYALFRLGARLFRRDLNSVLRPQSHPPFQERRGRAVKKATKEHLAVRETSDFTAFWGVLEDVLHTRHGLKPVHTLEEIKLLHQRFPRNIRLFAAFRGEELLAGTVIFENAGVAHSQYIASSPVGRDACALDLVFSELITTVFQHKRWFSFGISTESGGTYLNEGLTEYKEGFGARASVQDFYEITLS